MFLDELQGTRKTLFGQDPSQFLLDKVDAYSESFRTTLNNKIDKRLVRTFHSLFIIILFFRNRRMGLLLSELGGYLCGPAHAPAGTKRISNLLLSKKWNAQDVDDQLFSQATARVDEIEKAGKRPLLLWDDSRIEKHESWLAEGLCSVWSSKAKRLTRIRTGYYDPPKKRICVPGYKWTGVLLSHLGGVPSVCQMTWWTTRGKQKEDPDNIIYRLLRKIHQHLKQPMVHVLDRGYANEKMLRYLFHFNQHFILRWKKNHLLNNVDKGLKKTHLLSRSFKGKSSRIVRDKNRKKDKRVTIAWAPVNHPEYPENQLYLVIVRDKNNYNSPMYLLSSLPINSAAQAWEVMFSYMHRWEVEQGFRFLKSEMGLESPRLWFWENRMKLMAIVTLVYDFLLSLLNKSSWWVSPFLRLWCHRTGKRLQEAWIPLYRLRIAISLCLFCRWAQNSG